MKRYFILSLLVAFAFFTNAQTHEEGRLVGTHWSFNPNMEHNVTFSGIVFLDGESMQNRPRTADLEIGAFCGEECRGSALPMYFDVPIFQGYLYMMQIYSNNADGEQITFRVYDHALGEELNVTSQTTLDFVANAEYGNILDPFVIEFLSMPVVTTSVNLAEGGTVSGGGAYVEGATCTLTATPSPGYIFVNWTENAEVVSTEATYTFTVTGNRELVANFEEVPITIPLEGLIAYYPFNGNANDESGNGNHGTLQGNAPQLTTDRYGNGNSAYLFAGYYNSGYIRIPNSSSLQIDNAFSMSFWMNLSGYDGMDGWGNYTNNGYFAVICKEGDRNGFNTCLGQSADGRINLHSWNNNGSYDINTVQDYTLGEWMHCVVTIENNLSRIYINGVLQQENVMNQVNFSNANNCDLYLGIMHAGGMWYPFNGKLDDIILYNRALTSLEVNQLYGIDEDLIAYYPFDGDAYDYSGNQYHATPCNSYQYEEGLVGDCIAVEGMGYTGSSGGHVMLPELDFGASTGISVNLWVKSMGLSHNDGETYINFGMDTETDRFYVMEQPEQIRFVYHDAEISIPNESDYLGNWIMYSLTCDSSGVLKAYVNGSLIGEEEVAYEGVNTSFAALGRHWWSGTTYTRFIGSFDEVRIYGRALSPAELRMLYINNHGVEVTAIASPVEGGTVSGEGRFNHGEVATLIATPNEDYTFVSWTENGEVVSTEAEFSFNVWNNRNLTANFALPFTITASANPEAGGTVSGAGEYDYNTECTLSAIPNEDYYFVKWTKDGNVVSTLPTFSFFVTDEGNYMAHFTLKPVSTVIANYDPDPDDNQIPYVRVSWSRDYTLQEDFESGGFGLQGWETDWVISNNSYEGSYCMSSNNHGHGSSSHAQVTITIPQNGQMSFWSRVSSESNYDFGRFFIDGQQMGAWSGNGGWAQHTYNVSAGEHTFRWTYGKDGSVSSYDDCFHVDNISFIGDARGGNRAVDHYEVYRTAIPGNSSWERIADNVTDTSYVDMGWSVLAEGWYRYGVVATYSIGDSVCSTNMAQSNRILRAYPHAITVTANPTEGGTIQGAGDYVLYTECTLTATANENYTFINWTENGEVVSTDPTYSFTVTTDRDLVANFHLPFTVTATANPEEGGTIIGAGEYDYGTQCTLTATANENFVFISWTENGEWVTSDASFSFTVMGEKEYVAVFHPILDSISDDFNDGVIDAAQWTYRGSTVYENDGLMKIEQNVTDDDVRLTTFPMSLTPTGQIVMERRFKVHRASDYFSGGFAINLNGIGDEQSYIRVSYWHENYVNKHGTYIDALIDGQTTETFLCNAVFDTWMVEKIIVDTETGAFLYCINNEVVATTTIAGLASKDVSYYTIKFWPFSWWTGHYQYMDYVNINMDLGATYTVNASASPIEGGEVVGGGMFDLGQTCSLVATPNENYTFMYWTENDNVISAAPEYSFLVGVDRNLEAHFALPFHITASSNPEDGGVISGAGVYDYGTECTLTATANENYTFINWTENGEVVTTQPSFGFTVTEDRNFVANFTLPFNITASANPEEGGSIIGTGVYDYGTECSLTAIANEGYTFVYWSENGSLFSTEESIAFTAIEDRNFVANFVEGNTCAITFNLHDSYGDGWNGNRLVVTTDYGITHEVTLSSGSSGTQTLMLVDGHHVTLSWISGNWINECSFTVSYSNGNVIYPGTNLSGTSFGFDMDCERMPATMYDITVVAEPVEGGAVTGAGEYLVNTECQLTEAVNEGYTFINWTMNGNVVSTNPTYSFTVTDAANYVAHFELSSYNITIGANPTMGGTVTGEGTYNHFSTCTLTATPKLGYSFVNWTKDGNEVSTEETYSFMVTGGGEYVANFEIVDITQTVNLPHGWSWWSTYIETENNNALEQLETGMAENGVMIKSHDSGFLTYDIGLWMGNLNSINNESMYLINTSTDTEFGLTGRYAAPTTHIITLNPSWSWIGYPLGTATDVSRALANLDAMDGDMVKTSHSFAEYEDGYGWVGSLQTFYPGMGLMYYSSNNQEVSLIYAEGTRGGELKENITADGNHFMPTSNAHPFNMSLTAIAELEGNELHGGTYEIAAFAGNECRGSARLMDVEALSRYLAFLTIAGDEAATLSFRLFNVETGVTYYCDQNIVYETDAIVGSIKNPFVLHFNPSSTDCTEMMWSCDVYPNPVMSGEWVKINWGPIPTSEAKVEIVNALGAVVGVETVNSQPAFVKAPNVPGVYMLRITSEGKGSQIYKLIVK